MLLESGTYLKSLAQYKLKIIWKSSPHLFITCGGSSSWFNTPFISSVGRACSLMVGPVIKSK